MNYSIRLPYVIPFFILGLLFVITVYHRDNVIYGYSEAINSFQNQYLETIKTLEKDNIIKISLDDVIKEPFVINQDHPTLIKKIKEEYLFPPSVEPYNFTKGVEDPSVWQAAFVSKLLQQKRNGFFIEVGANDGEFISNSLVFEKRDGWSGLLIESDPDNYQMLLSKHRKAFTVPACLSNTKYPKTLEFQKLGPRSRLTNMKIETPEKVEVQCFPIYSILLALGRTKIDYFSLDVEGSEIDVLETIPWDKVEITAISVEYDNIMNRKEELRKLMEGKGYSWVDHPPGTGIAVDYIFYRKDLLPKGSANDSSLPNIS